MKLTERINFNQPKYKLPAILFIPLVFTGFFMLRFFDISPADVGDQKLETKEELNASLPEANIKGDGIGKKYESMLDSYGKISDATAVENVEREQQQKEEYNSQYSDAEMAALDQQSAEARASMEKLQKLQESLQQSSQREDALTNGLADRSTGNTPEEDETLNELRQALDAARQQADASAQGTFVAGKNLAQSTVTQAADTVAKKIVHNENAVTEISEDAVAEEAVKVTKETSEYFNTIAENEPEHKLIKAIIDEDVKVINGSRVRLRLLDDIDIGHRTIPRGSYIYCTMSGFSQQRIKGNVKSVLYDDELVKVNLSIYDTDGMEGLYVPKSNFRETSKDVMGGAFSGGSTLMGNETGSDNLARWGRQTLMNAYNKTTSAIAKAIKKNSVKLKYGTHVYLINSRQISKEDGR